MSVNNFFHLDFFIKLFEFVGKVYEVVPEKFFVGRVGEKSDHLVAFFAQIFHTRQKPINVQLFHPFLKLKNILFSEIYILSNAYIILKIFDTK